MTDLTMLLNVLTDDQKQALAAILSSSAPATEPAPAAKLDYYDTTEAVPAKFKADLEVSPKSRDTSYAERFDHVWCTGSYRVKGPKGGVYFVGRCVLGVKKGQQVKGTLRVGNKYFEAFLEGEPMDAWFRPEGESESILLGVLSNYRAV
jgi:hypothetical protein